MAVYRERDEDEDCKTIAECWERRASLSLRQGVVNFTSNLSSQTNLLSSAYYLNSLYFISLNVNIGTKTI